MHGTRDEVIRNLATIRDAIGRACARSDRDPSTVTVVAAAKTQPPTPVRWVVEAGLTAIGAELRPELRDLRDAVPGRPLALHRRRSSAARRTTSRPWPTSSRPSRGTGRRDGSRDAPAEAGRVLDALIEVDFTGERAGVAPDDVADFADRVGALEGLRLRGLMTIAPDRSHRDDARPWFRRLRALRDGSSENHPDVVDFSHGDVVGLRGRGRGRRYDGPHRHGAVRGRGRTRRDAWEVPRRTEDGDRRVEEDDELPRAWSRRTRSFVDEHPRGRPGAGPAHAAPGRA